MSRWVRARRDALHLASSLLIVACAGCSGRSSHARLSSGIDAASDAAADVAIHDAALGDVATVDAPSDAAVDASDASGACPVTLSPLLTFQLASGAFPDSGHPDVAVHAPPGFDACAHPGLIAFFHGFLNCAANILGSTDTACTTNGPSRPALHLSSQLDAAGVNALLVSVELSFDSASSDPGRLANPNGLGDLLHELLVDHVAPLVGKPLDVSDFERVVIAAHSSGYAAAAQALTSGGVSQVREVDLYDALYGDLPVFRGWIATHLGGFDPTGAPEPYRFVDLDTPAGGTITNSQALASDVTALLGDAGHAGWLFDAATAAPLVAGDLQSPMVFKAVDSTHDDLPRTTFELVIRASGFAALP